MSPSLDHPISLEEMKQIISRSPFNRDTLQPEIKVWERGHVELTVAIREGLTQFHGFAHGAVVGAVADIACAWSAASMVGSVVTAEYKINLFAPAVGHTLVGRGWVIKSNRRQLVCRADVFTLSEDQEEKQVAAALATVMPLQDFRS